MKEYTPLAIYTLTPEWRETSEIVAMSGAPYNATYQRLLVMRRLGLAEDRPSRRRIRGRQWRLRP